MYIIQYYYTYIYIYMYVIYTYIYILYACFSFGDHYIYIYSYKVINSSIYLSILGSILSYPILSYPILSTYLSIYLSVYLSIYLCIYIYIYEGHTQITSRFHSSVGFLNVCCFAISPRIQPWRTRPTWWCLTRVLQFLTQGSQGTT